MNLSTILLMGVLLWGIPAFSQEEQAADPKIRDGKFEWFLLTEDPDQVRKLVGPPRMVAPFGSDYLSWQYQSAEGDHDDFSHQFVFSKSERALVSVTVNFEPERLVDEFFPPEATSVCHYPDGKHPQYSIRVRRLSGGRLLIAPGSAKSGQPAGQMVLMRESALRTFYPWAVDQLAAAVNATVR